MAKSTQQYYIDICIKDEQFVFFNTLEASRSLTGAAFKVYIYLLMKGNQFNMPYAPKELINDLGISLSSTHNAFSELIKEKYLEEIESDHYLFTSIKF